MEPVRTMRKHKGFLKPIALVVVFLFFFQGIAVSCSSLLPEAKFHTPTIKKQGTAAKSMIKKPGKQVALLRGSVFVTCFTVTSPLENLQSGDSSTAIRTVISARAPPAPLARHIS